MKILQVITKLGLGGAETQVCNISKGLVNLGHEVCVVSLLEGGANEKVLNDAGIAVYNLGSGGKPLSLKALYRLIKLVNHIKPDVIHSWLYHADALTLGLRFFSQQGHLFWNLRSSILSPTDFGKGLFCLQKILAYFSFVPSGIVTNSRAGKVFHKSIGYRPRRWSVIPNAIDTDVFVKARSANAEAKAKLNLSPDVMLVGLIARYHPMKDHINFLKAAALVLQRISNVHFIFIGEGVSQDNYELLSLSQELKITHHCHFLGERLDISFWQPALDVATSSSYSEGFSNSLAEAMSCAVPSVSTNTGDNAFLIGETGAVVAPRDFKKLSEALINMLEMDGCDRATLGDEARERIKNFFSIDSAVSAYDYFYNVVCSENEKP
jgi:glycosyltransferase involved in cell wall biosynthesis